MHLLPEVTAMLDTVIDESGERVQLAGEGYITACVDFERSPAVLYVNVAVPGGGYAGCSCSKFGVQVPIGIHA